MMLDSIDFLDTVIMALRERGGPSDLFEDP